MLYLGHEGQGLGHDEGHHGEGQGLLEEGQEAHVADSHL